MTKVNGWKLNTHAHKTLEVFSPINETFGWFPFIPQQSRAHLTEVPCTTKLNSAQKMWQPFANAQQPTKWIPVKGTEAKITTSNLYNKYGPRNVYIYLEKN